MPARALEAVVPLLPAVRAAAAETERLRRLRPDLAAALADAGVFRLCVPRAVGGLEADPATLLATIEAVARADGSAGWCAMIGATTGLTSGYLDDAVARTVWSHPGVVTGGVFAPSGVATPVDGGWLVRGRWRFASGCQHCDWLMGGCIVRDDGPPRARMFLLPAGEVTIVDTWDTAGLRGTGSHDIVVEDRVVPEGRSVGLGSDEPVARGPLYAFPIFGLLAAGIAAVSLGIAARAVEELGALAATKTPTGMRRRLADRSAIQAEVARAEAGVAAARALLDETVAAAWGVAQGGAGIPLALRGRLRLAATHAVEAAAAATDRMYAAGGGSAIYADSPLQRAFRDVHVATQHMMVAPPTWELAGRLLLGVDADTSLL